MKSKLLPLTAGLFLIALLSIAQTTVTIDLSNCAVGMERSGDANGPAPAVPNFASYTWTCGGILCIGRTLMSIDLSSLPSDITIISAELSLYADPACTYLGIKGEPTYGVQNRGTVRRVISPWDPNTVTWNNQPSTTKENQIFLPSSQSDVQDYVDLDATAMIQDMVDDPLSNHGIIIKQSDEVTWYKSLILASCLHPDANLQPKLVVAYEEGEKMKPSDQMIQWFVEVSPNPASQKVFFEFSDFEEGETVELSIYDVSGRLIQEQATIIDEVIELDISQWKSGMYFFTAENKTTKSVYSGKLVVGQ